MRVISVGFTKLIPNLNIAGDVEEAIRFLYGKDKFLGSTLPDIIILDLTLPKKDGREVLREIKENKDLKNIPVIILTTFSAEKDRMKAWKSCLYYMLKYSHLEYIPEKVYLILNKNNIFQVILLTTLSIMQLFYSFRSVRGRDDDTRHIYPNIYLK
jgi:DNA-binding response OmpR family regulator